MGGKILYGYRASVWDARTNEDLSEVSVIDVNGKLKTQSERTERNFSQGYYLYIEAGTHPVKVSAPGYNTLETSIWGPASLADYNALDASPQWRTT